MVAFIITFIISFNLITYFIITLDHDFTFMAYLVIMDHLAYVMVTCSFINELDFTFLNSSLVVITFMVTIILDPNLQHHVKHQHHF